MRLTIIAFIVAIAALGLGSFATFTSLNDDEEATPVTVSGWSEAECLRAEAQVTEGRYTLWYRCHRRGEDCDAYADMLQAINDNCP